MKNGKNIVGIITGVLFISMTLIAHANVNPKIDSSDVWISIDADAIDLINKKYSSSITLNNLNLLKLSAGNIAVVSLPKDQLDRLSNIMHDNFKRCGGFVFHESFDAAHQFAVGATPTEFSAAVRYTIDNAAAARSLVNQMSASGLRSTVNSLSRYNNRYYTSTTGRDAANWIKNHWSSLGRSRSDISVQLYSHSWLQPSVIATITGTTRPNEIVIVGGHLDSINQRNRGGRAPGADDNASGIAVATATLRAIVNSGFKPERTIKIMGYAAEEVGLRGSSAIASSFKSSGKNVVGVVQFDMSGYKGTANQDIVFMSDYTNSAQNTFMTQLLDRYLPNVNYAYGRCGYACSDHASWNRQGYPASMPFESQMRDYNSSIHTANDSSYDQNHALNFAKLSALYIAELAKGSTR